MKYTNIKNNFDIIIFIIKFAFLKFFHFILYSKDNIYI